jgi:hypothetical protein
VHDREYETIFTRKQRKRYEKFLKTPQQTEGEETSRRNRSRSAASPSVSIRKQVPRGTSKKATHGKSNRHVRGQARVGWLALYSVQFPHISPEDET